MRHLGAKMDIRPLHTEEDYRAALAEVSALVQQDPARGSADGDRQDILSILVEHYGRSAARPTYVAGAAAASLSKVVTLGVDSRGAVSARFAAAMKGKARGNHITFASTDLLLETLTPTRWTIIRAMTGAGPLSLEDIALRAGRALSLHDDVMALLNTGVLEGAEEGAFVFPYEAVHVDFMLFASGSGSAN